MCDSSLSLSFTLSLLSSQFFRLQGWSLLPLAQPTVWETFTPLCLWAECMFMQACMSPSSGSPEAPPHSSTSSSFDKLPCKVKSAFFSFSELEACHVVSFKVCRRGQVFLFANSSPFYVVELLRGVEDAMQLSMHLEQVRATVQHFWPGHSELHFICKWSFIIKAMQKLQSDMRGVRRWRKMQLCFGKHECEASGATCS